MHGSGLAWADLGSGEGAFTLALAELLGPDARIVSIDRDPGALRRQRELLDERFPAHRTELREADFTRPLGLRDLDGVLMANSLHFVREKDHVLALVREMIAPAGRLLVVEYNSDRGNPWVPYPLSDRRLGELLERSGFEGPRVIGRVPSRFLREIYAIVATRPA